MVDFQDDQHQRAASSRRQDSISKIGAPNGLDSLPGFTRRIGGATPTSAVSLRGAKYGQLEIPHSSTEGFFKDDYFVGKWDPKFNQIRYFDEIQSCGPRGRLDPILRCVAITNQNDGGQAVDAFDHLGMAKTIQSISQQTTNAYVIFFGREQFPSLMVAASWSTRHLIEAAHTQAVVSFITAMQDRDADAATAVARDSTCDFLRERQILYYKGL